MRTISEPTVEPLTRQALAIAGEWLPPMLKLMRRALAVPFSVEVVDADLVEGAALREELTGAWMRFAENKSARLLLSFDGPIIDHVAGLVAAGSRGEQAAHALFSRVGDLALSSLTLHWHDHAGVGIAPVTTEADSAELSRTFFTADLLVCASVELTAPAPGRLILAGDPAAFTSARRPAPAPKGALIPGRLER